MQRREENLLDSVLPFHVASRGSTHVRPDDQCPSSGSPLVVPLSPFMLPELETKALLGVSSSFSPPEL